jgi:putative pyruvate formate lyase activating enzyme
MSTTSIHMPAFDSTPAYLQPGRRRDLDDHARRAREQLAACRLCPRECGIDRRKSVGDCRTGLGARLLAYIPAYQEEVTIVGSRGSGAIIFAGGELRKPGAPLNEQRYLGNPVDSSEREVSASELAGCMLELQAAGCHNINLVNPSHVVAQILEALVIAVDRGLHLPLIYNSNGYDSLEALALLEGVIDIYAPEMRFGYTREARRFLVVDDYPHANRAALREMHRQVGDLVLTDAGIASRGLLVRHVILPHGLAGSTYVVRFLARQISPDTYVHLVDDYRPTRSAKAQRELYRKITPREYDCAKQLASEAGLHRFGRAAFVERGPAIVI